MTDHAPLTDEELAELHAGRGPSIQELRRLIADLRASRAEVERLREQNEGLYQAVLLGNKEQEWLRAELDRLTASKAGAR